MMNYIWAALIIISIVFACFSGGMTQLSDTLLQSGNEAITLGLTLMGGMCLWSGIMRLADKAGITIWISRLFSPVLRRILPGVKAGSEAEKAVTMNVAANLLGLGNAATPLGLKAMGELHKLNGESDTASNAMITFVVLNTASIQLIPSTVALLRAQHGSENAMMILPFVWISSIITVVIGITICKILCKGRGIR